jgi:rubrerythrin
MMIFSKHVMLGSLIIFGLALLLCNPAIALEAKKATSLDNLQTAFNGESNAQARYQAFAKKADEEGYTQVGSLFRAASKAEGIHAAHHAEVIKKLGGNPKAEIAAPVIKSTQENLKAALEGETYEKEKMYPEFIATAEAEQQNDALRVFNYAKSAEIEHAKLYTAALKDLPKWKGGTRNFYVCPVCGFTVEKINFTECPICYTPKDKYELVK